ncbi:MAG: GTPase HflX [Gammaproteobacteria bacterium]|nr:GTPase HflX [Gammaproteobacteria bacterium]
MIDRPQSGTRALLVNLNLRSRITRENAGAFEQLAISAGVTPVGEIRGVRDRPDSKLFVGTGKADEILATIKSNQAELVLFNHELTPVQERNLERHLSCRVVDRTGLILDIFAQRARTFEGKLQVELAQLQHLATRLVRGWSHLERQKGGIGLRGPGETQLELDRRLIGRRIRQLHKRLEKVRRHRELSRSARRKATVPSVSLVGYTNAGKSTLFNRLTGSEVYAANQLFATLDPTLRRLDLAGFGHVVLADTVGFINDLPPDLIAAFRATLEETQEADLLLHVIDSRDEEHLSQVAEVNQVLRDIGAGDIPQIEVYNKIDLGAETAARIDRDAEGRPSRVWLSARDGQGMDLLLQAIQERLLSPVDSAATSNEERSVSVTRARSLRAQVRLAPAAAGRIRARLYEWSVVREERVTDGGEWIIEAILRLDMLGYLQQQTGCRVVIEGEACGCQEACGESGGTIQSATV